MEIHCDEYKNKLIFKADILNEEAFKLFSKIAWSELRKKLSKEKLSMELWVEK